VSRVSTHRTTPAATWACHESRMCTNLPEPLNTGVNLHRGVGTMARGRSSASSSSGPPTTTRQPTSPDITAPLVSSKPETRLVGLAKFRFGLKGGSGKPDYSRPQLHEATSEQRSFRYFRAPCAPHASLDGTYLLVCVLLAGTRIR
jgi:hypothetical protein